MTQEDKELLIKDLCTRLPYKVKVRYSSYKEFITCTLHSIKPTHNIVDLWSKDACFNSVYISKIKPYLFPLSSMTEEQKYEYDELIHSNNIKAIEGVITSADCSTAEIDWFNKNNFDYRGLIPKDLAIDATGKNIY